MATCKYFQQGNCRFGQYCRFAHTYNVNYGENSTLATNKPSYTGIKTVAFAVAEEVLAVERGGQWLLSCFGPFKERPCIPGMEDLSPDEFHWEMYQAQKSGTVDQTKLQFQQLCQEMKGKLALLKNPTPEIVAMLESLQKGSQENALTKPSNFSFATPQLAIPSSSASATNLFTSKPFNAANPFVGSTATFGSSGSTPFAFSNAPNTGVSSAFGANPTFGTNPVFGGTTNPAPAFGGAVKSPTSVFTGANQNASSFGSPPGQNVSVFNSPPAFSQSTAFNTSTQESTPFGRLQSTQSNAIFGGTTTLTNSVFGATGSAQTSASIFGGTQPASTTLFGGSTQQTSGSLFGGSAVAGNTPLGSVTSPFGQSKTNVAFGGGPVFGGAPTFGAQASPGIFGGQSNFGNVPTSSSNIFGNGNAAAPTFGSIGQSVPGSFGSMVKSSATNFGETQNPPPFGSPVPTANTGPFGSAVSTASSPFVTSTGPFSTSAVASTPFSGLNVFGQSVDTTSGFGTNSASANTPFGAANVPDASPFSQGSPFGTVANSSPFSNTNTTVTTTTANLFATQSQTVSSSPFGGSGLTNQGSIFATSQSTPFTNSPFASVQKEIEILDDNAFTMEGHLTDDEKAMYLAKQFVLGKIPLKPPTKDLR